MTPPADRLAEIAAREKAATVGPWKLARITGEDACPVLPHEDHWDFFREYFEAQPTGAPNTIVVDYRDASRLRQANLACANFEEPDARFLVAAREDIPWLLAELARVTAERDRAKTALEVIVQLGFPAPPEPGRQVHICTLAIEVAKEARAALGGTEGT